MYATIIASLEIRLRLRGVGGGLRVVAGKKQDAAAAVALDDGGVPADLVEHLRAEPHVTDGAEAVAGFRGGDALSILGRLLKDGEHAAIDFRRKLGSGAVGAIQLGLKRGQF